jgi:hypothetical protein
MGYPLNTTGLGARARNSGGVAAIPQLSEEAPRDTIGVGKVGFLAPGFSSSAQREPDCVEVVIKCKTLPRWFAGTSALDGGFCEQKVSRYCRYVYQYGKIGPSTDPDRKTKMRKWVYGYRSQCKTVKEVL